MVGTVGQDERHIHPSSEEITSIYVPEHSVERLGTTEKQVEWQEKVVDHRVL